MTKRLIVFQHGPLDGTGALLLDSARRHKTQLTIIEVWHQPIPALTPYAGLIVLGGGANINQERRYPFLRTEKERIAASIAEDRPYLGFCLGHQLLAEAMGAKIGDNLRASLGVIRGFLTHMGREHGIFAGFEKTMPLFKWHTQMVHEPLPAPLQILATSADCPVEAISVRDRPHLVGLQSDSYAADPADVAAWLAKDERWLAGLNNGEIDPTAILTHVQRYREALRDDFARLFTNFLKYT
ncbi:MAG: type 1 glutamine amidotransferase [Desulfobulbaceae bacterium]|nr:type 1 glutamine amidotransferase [Desulfobulbaceae bacterium]